LGLNPGGDPSTHEETVGSCLAAWEKRTDNAYLDESWTGRARGRAPLQRRVQWLMGQLGFSVRDVCASNLIFTRSIDASGSGYPQIADLCWPVHEQILEIVRPRLILAFGNSNPSPFSYLRDKHRPRTVTTFPSGHGKWKCAAFTTNGGLHIVGLPHLSRYAVNKHLEVADWIKAYAAL
jgi:uracil-DNA glycosylase